MQLPSWIRIEYHEKETCTFWAITLKTHDGKWAVYKNGASACDEAKIHAEQQAGIVLYHVTEVFDQPWRPYDKIKVSGCLAFLIDMANMGYPGRYQLYVKRIAIYWPDRAQTYDTFVEGARMALQLGI